MGKRDGPELHPYAVLGALLASELDARPPRLSRKRKRLRTAMRARLAGLAVERERERSAAPEVSAPA
ncbi:MAG: hypothetical protein ACRDOS_05865 [Gaiellaceae bacterium]